MLHMIENTTDMLWLSLTGVRSLSMRKGLFVYALNHLMCQSLKYIYDVLIDRRQEFKVLSETPLSLDHLGVQITHYEYLRLRSTTPFYGEN